MSLPFPCQVFLLSFSLIRSSCSFSSSLFRMFSPQVFHYLFYFSLPPTHSRRGFVHHALFLRRVSWSHEQQRVHPCNGIFACFSARNCLTNHEYGLSYCRFTSIVDMLAHARYSLAIWGKIECKMFGEQTTCSLSLQKSLPFPFTTLPSKGVDRQQCVSAWPNSGYLLLLGVTSLFHDA